MQFDRIKGNETRKHHHMKKERTRNEEVKDEATIAPDAAESAANTHPDDNMADGGAEATDTMAADAAAAPADAAQQAAEWKDKYLRLQAEFDNYRKRTLREKMELVETGGRDVLLAMLPVRDDVERAVAAMEKSDDVEALRSGVRLIAQKFTEALRQRGVVEIEVRDREFDAEVAEAVARFAAGEERKGKVIDVVQTGYKLGERVLRFAKVVVGE